ncbi:MAG: SDR family NAD(P)-dependent oxidoreductase, partial [Acetobacteraceae bacterium]|nr:SDR family NAD(P)-dependent oxidoreductase [Acetobacteraceae bacterium]
MTSRVLITGGAGFIGSHVARALLQRGVEVRVLDNLLDQVHPPNAPRNPILDHVEFVEGDVRDADAVARCLVGVDKIVHLAAEVGVGQSMYRIERYVSVNDLGTGVLFQALTANPVARIVVASSMSVYGEGLYRAADGRLVDNAVRPAQRHRLGWDPVDANGEPLVPVATPEWKSPTLASVYAITKYVQERLTLTVAPTYGM